MADQTLPFFRSPRFTLDSLKMVLQAISTSGTFQLSKEQFRFVLIPGVLVWHLIADEISRRYVTIGSFSLVQF
jgi:hypothetical protein